MCLNILFSNGLAVMFWFPSDSVGLFHQVNKWQDFNLMVSLEGCLDSAVGLLVVNWSGHQHVIFSSGPVVLDVVEV